MKFKKFAFYLQWFVFVFVGFLCSRGFAQDGENKIVICGTNTVVLFKDQTADGHYAAGWTLIPKNAHSKPINWSLWITLVKTDPDNVNSFFDQYPFDFDDKKAPYKLLDCFADLQRKRMIPLHSQFSYFPHKKSWESDKLLESCITCTQYAMIENDARWYTENLWLVTANDSTMHAVDIADLLGRVKVSVGTGNTLSRMEGWSLPKSNTNA